MDALGVQRADMYPRVSTHIDDIIAMIKTLIDKATPMNSMAMYIIVWRNLNITVSYLSYIRRYGGRRTY